LKKKLIAQAFTTFNFHPTVGVCWMVIEIFQSLKGVGACNFIFEKKIILLHALFND
jgi:hypothetical protein